MRKWVRTSAKAALLTAGFVALGTGVAMADTGEIETSGNGSVLSGNQIVANADVPVNVAGNAISAVGGVAGASAEDTGAVVLDRGRGEVETSGNGSVLSGNQIVADLDVPVNASGNAIAAVLSTAGASSEDTGSAVVHQRGGGDEIETSGNGSILGGNQAVVDLDVPVNVAGNAISAVGGVAGASAEDTGAVVFDRSRDEIETSGNGSIAGGNQLVVDGDVPVNVSGNAISAILGVAGAASEDTGSAVVHTSGWGKSHDHDHGYRTSQLAPVDTATVTGLINTVKDVRPAELGASNLAAGPVQHQRGGGDEIETSGNGSILGGNQAVVDLDVPVNVAGNAISAVGGVAGASAEDTGAVVFDRSRDEIETSGNGSIAGGNQLVVDGDVPVNVSGNAISAILGVAGAASEDTGSAVIETGRSHQAAPVLAPEETSLYKKGMAAGDMITRQAEQLSGLPKLGLIDGIKVAGV
ncbi:chaplin family protein [Nocardiopsis ansamitocini]|uniref:Chaplin domain-containing protein n=1 Tax=Nocardiopsis ansamitocini TaxID=1670832 RepID=A0A9W6PBJ1_9ACTN|nr:chaplin family protein [Nocardiopsis ansamitocini]GLU50498.1 hypothetical protein Nans01_48490 [Nocardiopsis ansamitocini]